MAALIGLPIAGFLGLNTVRGIIERWAPPSENDTGAYVRNVAKRVGVHPDAAINLGRIETARDIMSR